MSDHRPVALTSIPFKRAETIIIRQLRVEMASKQDPLQFATDRTGTPKTPFIDFSSAFNTIQPHPLMNKLLAMSVNPTQIQWLFSFLTGRTQRVQVGKDISSTRTTNTGALQGFALSPALFTLCTAVYRSKQMAVC